MSQRHDELETMTELAAFLMALMLTVELGVAIAFGAAWLATGLHASLPRPTIKPTKTNREKPCQRHEAQASI